MTDHPSPLTLEPSSPHPSPSEWLDKAVRRLNEPGGFVYTNDLVLLADVAHALSVTLESHHELLAALRLAIEPGPDAARGPRRTVIEAAIQKAESHVQQAEGASHV